MAMSDLEIVDRLPNRFDPGDGDPVPQDLIGATILRFGTLSERGRAEGGGLAIKFRPRNTACERTLVFEFTGEGMWLERPLCTTMDAAPE